MNRCLKYFCFLLLALAAIPGSGQYNKARSLYNDNYFSQAIPLLKKSLDGKNSKQALESLAHSLRMMRNYPEAEIYYRKLIELGDPAPSAYFYFGEVLMNNGKYDEAEEQFMIYASLAPQDPKSKLMINAIKELKQMRDNAPGFAVSSVSGINSEFAEFSPVPFKDGIVFATEKSVNHDYVSIPSEGLWKTRNLNLFYAPYRGTDSVAFGEFEKMERVFNLGHLNGPVSFSKDASVAVFTRVKKVPEKNMDTNYPRLYQTVFNGKKWSRALPVFTASEGYSDAHPALSPDGKILYFSSNRPGGQGGYDLYMSKLENGTWSSPVNLGTEVNTILDDAFPYISPEGVLYFSSEGHSGLGGLDLFSTENLNGAWQQPQNLLAPLNSTGDDFSLMLKSGGVSGFFSSNRQGSTGLDDIYHFTVLDKKINIAGKLFTGDEMNDPARNLNLVLVTEDGTVIQTTSTDETGAFIFVNLPADQLYLVKLAEDNTGLSAYSKVFMADKNGVVYKKTTTDNEGGFTFYNLPGNASGLNGEIEDDTRITVTGSLLAGANPARPLSGQKVYLTDESGKVVSEGFTDQYGNFKFEHLPPDGNFLVSMNPEDTKLEPNTRIVVTDSKGKTVRTFFTNAQGGFKFEVLTADNTSLRLLEEENTSIRIDLKGKLLLDDKSKKPLPNSNVNLVNERGEVVQTAKTDGAGNFHFTNLPSDQNYMVQVLENDVPVNTRTLYVADERGKIMRKLLFGEGGYKFEILQGDHKTLASIYVEDPWLKMKEITESKKDSITVIENIYYEYGKFEVLPEAASILNKVVGIMKDNPDIFIELSSHTDSRSSAEFNTDLSRKRARAAVDYIISKGIPASRIQGVGLGESKPVNYCTDDVECTEEQHQQNRRTEFKVVKIR